MSGSLDLTDPTGDDEIDRLNDAYNEVVAESLKWELTAQKLRAELRAVHQRLETARRDALNEAADQFGYDFWSQVTATDVRRWLRARAAAALGETPVQGTKNSQQNPALGET